MPPEPPPTARLLVAGIPNPILVQALRQAAGRGCEVLVADNPTQATAAVRQCSPNLVLVGLPGTKAGPWEQLAAAVLAQGQAELVLVPLDGATAPEWATAQGAAVTSDASSLSQLIGAALGRAQTGQPEQATPTSGWPGHPSCVGGLGRSLDTGGSLLHYCESVADGLRHVLGACRGNVGAVTALLVRSPGLCRKRVPGPGSAGRRRGPAHTAWRAAPALSPLATAQRTYGTLSVLAPPARGWAAALSRPNDVCLDCRRRAGDPASQSGAHPQPGPMQAISKSAERWWPPSAWTRFWTWWCTAPTLRALGGAVCTFPMRRGPAALRSGRRQASYRPSTSSGIPGWLTRWQAETARYWCGLGLGLADLVRS